MFGILKSENGCLATTNFYGPLVWVFELLTNSSLTSLMAEEAGFRNPKSWMKSTWLTMAFSGWIQMKIFVGFIDDSKPGKPQPQLLASWIHKNFPVQSPSFVDIRCIRETMTPNHRSAGVFSSTTIRLRYHHTMMTVPPRRFSQCVHHWVLITWLGW